MRNFIAILPLLIPVVIVLGYWYKQHRELLKIIDEIKKDRLNHSERLKKQREYREFNPLLKQEIIKRVNQRRKQIMAYKKHSHKS